MFSTSQTGLASLRGETDQNSENGGTGGGAETLTKIGLQSGLLGQGAAARIARTRITEVNGSLGHTNRVKEMLASLFVPFRQR